MSVWSEDLWKAEARGREGSPGKDLQKGQSCRKVRRGRRGSRACADGSEKTTKKTGAPACLSLPGRILTSPEGDQEEGQSAGRVRTHWCGGRGGHGGRR